MIGGGIMMDLEIRIIELEMQNQVLQRDLLALLEQYRLLELRINSLEVEG